MDGAQATRLGWALLACREGLVGRGPAEWWPAWVIRPGPSATELDGREEL